MGNWTEEEYAAYMARLKQPPGVAAATAVDDKPEAEIQAECIKLLEEDSWWVLRTDPVSDRKRATGFGCPGFADVTAFRVMQCTQLVPLQRMPKGCACEVLFIEFKARKGKPSSAQLKWHADMRAIGFATFIAGIDFAASVAGFKEFYEASGLMRRPKWWL